MSKVLLLTFRFFLCLFVFISGMLSVVHTWFLLYESQLASPFDDPVLKNATSKATAIEIISRPDA